MKEILDRVSDEAIEVEYQRREKLDRDSMSGQFPTFNEGGKFVRKILVEEMEMLREENSKLKMTIKRLQPRRLIDED